MDITGTVNGQCSHIFIWSSVDLQLGERCMQSLSRAISLTSWRNRFANTDYALAIAVRERHPNDPGLHAEQEDIDRISSYDCNCQYSVHVVKRFEKSFPDIAHLIRRTRWSIPALHVQGHKEDCLYNFSTAYMPCVGHFHGETAEFYWPEANQLGPHVRQMNNGHRQDTLIDHHGDWNWKKTMKMGEYQLLRSRMH
jgi:hypothetical protein